MTRSDWEGYPRFKGLLSRLRLTACSYPATPNPPTSRHIFSSILSPEHDAANVPLSTSILFLLPPEMHTAIRPEDIQDACAHMQGD